MLSRERFLSLFEQEFDLEPGTVDFSTRLVFDLCFDSVEFLRVVLFLEELSEFEWPKDSPDFSQLTVANLYQFHCVTDVESALRT